MPRVGEYRHPITVQHPVVTAGVEDWQDLVLIFAAKELLGAGLQHRQVSGGELFDEQMVQGEERYRFRTHHRTDIERRHRLKDVDGNIYEIEAVVDPKGEKKELHILALLKR